MEKVIKIARFTYIKTSIILLLLSICFHTYSQKETYSIKRKILLISIHDRDMRLEKFLANKHYRKTSRALNDELSELVFHDTVYHLKTNLKDLHFWGDTIIGYIWDSQEAGVKIHIVKFNDIKMMLKNDLHVDTIKSLEFHWWELIDPVNPVFRRPYSRPSLISGNDFWIFNYNGITVQNGIRVQDMYSELNIDYVYASAVVDNAPLYLYRSKNDKYYILHNNQHQQLLFDEINYLKTSYDSEFPAKERITFYGKKGLFWYSVVIK